MAALRQVGKSALGEAGRPLDQIQTGGKVITVGEQNATAQLGVVVQPAISGAQIAVHLQIKGIAFFRSVQADRQDMVTRFDSDVAHR